MNNRWVCALVSGCMMFALGCAAQSANRTPGLDPAESHVSFHVEALPDGVQVKIDGERPLIYTAFRLPDPPRLIIDLAGVAFAPDQQPVNVNKGAVTAVNPVPGTADVSAARLEIGLTELVDYQLRPDGSHLLVSIASPPPAATSDSAVTALSGPEPAPSSAEAMLPPIEAVPAETVAAEPPPSTPAAPVEPPAATGEPAGESMRDATVLTAIHVDSISSRVNIQGNGKFHATTMMLSGPRLVIDLSGISSRVASPQLAVNGPVLRQIRIGEHKQPQKVRVVLDLVSPASYELEQTGETLTVTLAPKGKATPAAAPDAPPASASKPDAKEAAVPLPSPPKKSKVTNAQLETDGADTNGNGVKENGQRTSTVQPEKTFSGRRISLDFQEADLDDVLRLMADVSGLNIVVGEAVTGKVTLKLLNVPWDQALELILRTNGLGQVREGNILRIDTLVNLAKQQEEEAKAKESAIRAEDLVTRVMYVNYATAQKLVATLQKSLSTRGEITTDERTNALIVKDVVARADEVAALLKVLDLQTPQVLIEARIVAADTEFARDLGVQWTADFTATGTDSTGGAAGSVNLPASGQAGPLGNFDFAFGRLAGNPFTLDLRLSAGEKQGLSKTISAPRIAVLDNQEAKIQQGTSIPYTSQTDTQVTTIFVDATLVLEVTPHVTPDGSVLMKLRVANDEPGIPASAIAPPPIRKKEARTNIMVKDGETAVLGGIYISTKITGESGIPWLYKIPVLGWLFKQQSNSETTNELLVFLTPKIIR